MKTIIIFLNIFFVSCQDIQLGELSVNSVSGFAPVASNISPTSFNEDTQSVITLSYVDVESDEASACSLSGLSNVIVTQACACSSGICTVGVTGTADYNGAASFSYTVTANSQTSNSANANFTINPVADAPVASNITPSSFDEDVQSILTLSYIDADGDQASSCAVSSLTNVTVTQACACSSGICTVGVTGTADYNGAASFSYTVTANSQTSNSANANFTINPVADAPVASFSSGVQLVMDNGVQKIITLEYTDADGDQASSCNIISLIGLSISQACSCSSGVCTVGLSSSTSGSGSFNYIVTANSQTSNTASVTAHIDEWIQVPANAGGGGLSSFYIMKYEAKAINTSSGVIDSDGQSVSTSTSAPISDASNLPWRYINASNAASECESRGSKFHLVSNSEWMAIARDIESQGVNWTGSSVGSGCLFRGNSQETSCGYDGANPEGGTSRNSRAKLTLSNSFEIFDFAGNVWEWTDWDSSTVGFQVGPQTCTEGYGTQLPSVTCPGILDSEYNSDDGTYTSTQGVGTFRGGSTGAAVRGGGWNTTIHNGVFALNLYYPTTASYPTFGFRCVYRP